jgi:hypothetical protein
MTELDQAWAWYQATRVTLKLAERLGEKYWDELPWEGSMGRDNRLRGVEANVLRQNAQQAQQHLDDLAIMLMFSAFEGLVRNHAANQVQLAAASLSHPVLIAAGKEATRSVARGPFWYVLDAYAKGGHAGVADQVRRIRKYRNWVSHGRRGTPQPTIEPKTVYDQLRAFLVLILPPPPPVESSP